VFAVIAIRDAEIASNGNRAGATGKGLKTIAFMQCKNDICISVKNLYLKLQIFECCNQARRRC